MTFDADLHWLFPVAAASEWRIFGFFRHEEPLFDHLATIYLNASRPKASGVDHRQRLVIPMRLF
jgi:hypothetical protein